MISHYVKENVGYNVYTHV